MKMVSQALAGFWHDRQPLRGEKPLPDEILCAVFIFLFKLFGKEGSIVPVGQIHLMQVHDAIPMGQKILPNGVWYGGGSIFFAFPVMDRQDGVVEIEILHSQLKAFKEAESAAVKQTDNQIVGIWQAADDAVDFL